MKADKVTMTNRDTLDQEASSYEKEDIVAAATNISYGAPIAILRMSGKDCHKKFLKTLKENTKTTANVLKRARFLDVTTRDLIDDAMVVFFHAPSSYTGEDSAELHLHGSPFVARKALSNLQRAGFRLAEPGEFTKRAYLNEKLDLIESEGISNLITASSEQEWLSAKYLLEGKLQDKIKELHKNLLEVMAFLEAQIDFPEEEDTIAISRSILKEKAKKVFETIQSLITSYENGKITSEGLKVGLIGPPNAGKSSLMNALLEKDRAIVTDTPGTTRDYLEERCLLKGRLISLVDTAGLRETEDIIEKKGVLKAKEIAQNVDLILFLFPLDQDESTFKYFEESIKELKKTSHLTLFTKSDLTEKSFFQKKEGLFISAKTKENLDLLQDKIIEKIDYHTNAFKNSVSITSTRHLSLLEEASNKLETFLLHFETPHYEEILAFELREINDTLSRIIGSIHTEDLLEEIFSRFCIGK